MPIIVIPKLCGIKACRSHADFIVPKILTYDGVSKFKYIGFYLCAYHREKMQDDLGDVRVSELC